MQQKPIDNESEVGSSLADDQKERGYYYDDSHGYEEYDPAADDPGEDEDMIRHRTDSRCEDSGDDGREDDPLC